jgi:hypothetical protein
MQSGALQSCSLKPLLTQVFSIRFFTISLDFSSDQTASNILNRQVRTLILYRYASSSLAASKEKYSV